MEIDDEVAQEALEAVEAGNVWHHFLVAAGDPAFFCINGCDIHESVLQYLMQERLIARALLNQQPATTRDATRMPRGIPVELTAAGEDWLAGQRRLGRNSRGV